MKTHQLEYFLAIAKCQSFSAAAVEVFISQSTLSQQMQKLESELGVTLFVRNARSVCLTPAGEDFQSYAKRIMLEMELCKETMQEYTSYKKGHLRIGIVPYMMYLGFNKIIADFLKAYQDIELKLYTADTDYLLKGLREKKIMISFITSPYSDEYEVEYYPLLTEKIVMLVSSSHKFAGRSIIDLRDARSEKYLLVDSGMQFRSSLLHAIDYDLQIIHESYNVDMIRSLVQENIGIALLGNRLAEAICNSDTAIVPITQVLEQQSGLAIPRSKRLTLTTKAFRDFTAKANTEQ